MLDYCPACLRTSTRLSGHRLHCVFLSSFLLFFFLLRFYLLGGEREREHEWGQEGGQREREQTPRRARSLMWGLDPGTVRS